MANSPMERLDFSASVHVTNRLVKTAVECLLIMEASDLC